MKNITNIDVVKDLESKQLEDKDTKAKSKRRRLGSGPLLITDNTESTQPKSKIHQYGGFLQFNVSIA